MTTYKFFCRSLLSELSLELVISCDEEATKCLKLIESLLNYELGVVAIDVEESSIGDRFLESAQTLLDEHFGRNLHIILLHLKILNSASLIRSSFADYEKALFVLKRAESLYKDWRTARTENSSFLTIAIKDLFNTSVCSPHGPSRNGEDSETCSNVEKEYTQTVYYLAQVLEKRGECELAAKYCTETLVRQFESGDYEPIDWSVNAAILSQYYACHDMFGTARRLLAVAQFQLDRVQDEESELLGKRRADLDRIFVKYCMILLEKSNEEQVGSDDASRILSMSDPEVDRLETGIPAARAVSYDTALTIFLFANKRLAAAINFFTLNEHASDHADCILDQSKLYQLLIHFQSEAGKICKMHKRRIDLLQKLLMDLNPAYFLAHVRRILFELGETYSDYSEMVRHKVADAEDASEGQVIRSAAVKVNALTVKAIQHFTRFVDSFRDKNGQLPVRFDADTTRPVLVAWFATGRLHTKKISSFPNEQLQFWTDSETCYQQIVEYINKNPDQEHLIHEEIKVVREMLPLIPEKKKLILSASLF